MLTYYVLAFAISWGGGLLVIGGPGGVPATAEQFTAAPLVIPMLFAGPASRILLTILVDGRAGWRAASPLAEWRVGACWYAVALSDRPACVHGGTTGAFAHSQVFLPTILLATDKASFLLSIATTLVVGFCEEMS